LRVPYTTNLQHIVRIPLGKSSLRRVDMALSVSGGETFSLSAAQKNERNILARLQRSHATKQLYQDLWRERKTIEAVAAHHLGRIEPSACSVQGTDTWLMGQFNICIIIHVHESDDRTSKKIFRCPMPHKVGEQYSPGAVDEKMRAEVATYAWIETKCPDIPIPYLHAFGLSSSLQVCRLCLADPRRFPYSHVASSSPTAHMALATSEIHPTADSITHTCCWTMSTVKKAQFYQTP
jgi:hypothetical protein